MLINLLIYAVAAAFSVYVIVTACRNFVGYNPTAPSAWTRLKAWWPGFVKRNIVDDDPYDDESHAITRYRDDYIDWSKVPDRFDWVAVEENGCLFPWETEPQIVPGGWNTGLSAVGRLVNDASIGPLPPWRESLRKRPGK